MNRIIPYCTFLLSFSCGLFAIVPPLVSMKKKPASGGTALLNVALSGAPVSEEGRVSVRCALCVACCALCVLTSF